MAEEKKAQAVQKIEVELSSEKTRIYDSAAELREAILKSEVSKSFRARTVEYEKDNPKPDQKWSTVETIAVSNAGLRSLYRPVWDYTLKYLGYGVIAAISIKAIDTTVTIFSADGTTGIVWLIVLGSLFFAKKWPLAPALAIFLSFKFGVGANLFITVLAIMLVGFLFGAPLGMVVGTIVGHFKRTRATKAPDATPEGWRPYVLGIIAPLLFLVVLVPLYYWFNLKMLEWIQK